MYLLNTGTLTLESFYTNIPDYAILSHTWGKKEVTFQDIQNQVKEKSALEAGWKKVEGACAHARKYGWRWIWIDSCCIDKSSSAELSENINSMYQLYENAGVCYVYLSDASSEEDPRDTGSRFWKSKWFTRGWTLQELIAPSASVVFLDHSWEEIGTRYSLRDVISAITSVPIGLLEDGDLRKYSIAQKMSWAAFRKTTREEDRAYSLMGLFDICMPPIYGEGGAKAFMRLQQEIIKTSDDRSIFAWPGLLSKSV
ncbi:HET-domain-containing protein [Dendrothele bispora CBS 962.96]|uniref:HET-domain-containing protein n=1 Tax=Dendrothele bispora (strain CBS 962.96) TaxID=1314807 RepID=A0A4S8LWE6_DENBC|nr:HET-domain-containing protein [Dendrothele bispora CBS 962.96]